MTDQITIHQNMVSFFIDVPYQLMIMKNYPGLKCLVLLLFMITPSASALSFNFTSFSSLSNTNYITCLGSAELSNNSIHLTSNLRHSVGRATYAHPLHLWDGASGSITDFTTHFSFVVDSLNKPRYGDGFTFFLATTGQAWRGWGGSLGLTELLWNSTDMNFVAVEFDIFSNAYDPSYVHVGINVNAINSVTSTEWFGANRSIVEGMPQEAWISYDSQSRNLSVVFTGYRNGSSTQQSLSYMHDLRTYLPQFVMFGFSASTGRAVAAQKINSWSFSSKFRRANDTIPGTPNGTRTASRTPNHDQTDSVSTNIALVTKSVVRGSVLALALWLLAYYMWKKRNMTMNGVDWIGDEFEGGSVSKKFAYNDLKAATNNFAEEHKLGAGGFGSVYKGFLKASKSKVAVKRISSDSKQGIKEFSSEVKIISRLRHRNLVQLFGWCHEKKELLLVYEFMPNGSLDFHLFKGKSLLDWATRFRIVNGLASALLYLHEEWEQYVLHRDIKSSNIMLDANFNAKLGDFGLAKLVDHEKQSETTFPAGTWRYMSPEYMINCRASKKTDIFSFGVVALEIATGQKSRHLKPNGYVQDLAEWVWSFYRTENLIDAADPQLKSDFNLQEMEQLLSVGLWCAHPDRNSRPSIREAIRVLKFEAPLPVLPVPVDLSSSPYESDVSNVDLSSSPYESDVSKSFIVTEQK